MNFNQEEQLKTLYTHNAEVCDFINSIPLALTFDDISLVPSNAKFHPSEANTRIHLGRGIYINIPIVSAAMDTVTEAPLAIAIAREGGIGCVHRAMTIEEQAAEIIKVKQYTTIRINNPITIHPDASAFEAIKIMRQRKINGIPVVTENNILVGILTRRDLRGIKKYNCDIPVKELMTGNGNLITSSPDISIEEAEKILIKIKKDKLPLVRDGKLRGLITYRDIDNRKNFKNASMDSDGKLLVLAAVGTTDALKRTQELVNAGTNGIVIDSSHGDSDNVIMTTQRIRYAFPKLLLISGNVVTAEGAMNLSRAGADIVKVGIGPGSICTTREGTGAGTPQVSAIKFANINNISIMADGGFKFPGDIVKGLALGAQSVMLGSMLAGTDEAPGEEVIINGMKYKSYRGMGSLAAMKKGSKDRYYPDKINDTTSEDINIFFDDNEEDSLFEQGVAGKVPAKGSIKTIIDRYKKGLQSGMGLTGCKNIKELNDYLKDHSYSNPRIVRMTNFGLQESRVHGVLI